MQACRCRQARSVSGASAVVATAGGGRSQAALAGVVQAEALDQRRRQRDHVSGVLAVPGQVGDVELRSWRNQQQAFRPAVQIAVMPLQALLALTHVADAGQADEDLAQLLLFTAADARKDGARVWAERVRGQECAVT